MRTRRKNKRWDTGSTEFFEALVLVGRKVMFVFSLAG